MPLRAPIFATAWLLLTLLCAGCASPAIEQAERLSRAGRYEDALGELDRALRARPDDAVLRTAHSRQRARVVVQVLAQADLALASGRLDESERLLERARQIDALQPRLAALEQQLAQARLEHRRAAPAPPPPLLPPAAMLAGPAFNKPVSLEFRDAPLREVFEALARSSQVNFVFDKEVRADSRITVFLRAVTLDEAMRIILSTQQLDRKLLNDSTVLVYPNTAVKQREHQDLITRTLYLTHADARQAQLLVRTMAKTRDLHVDERLNALIVRDTPQVVAMVEHLLATVDLPEPEVMLAVEVMEVATDRLEELGINWPRSIGYGLPGSAATVPIASAGLRGLVANPALAASLYANDGSTNLLANPTIRARNHEKAKVQIGEKLPVFTTTVAANVGISSSVSYMDVGLKLDVEPSVQLDGEVIIKVALEVTNLLREVSGPQGSLAYQLGTRLTTTSLRLQDGQTQVLAGLISDEDRRRATGLPGLAQLPLLGRLFGLHSDSRSKTEIVMTITPHIVHNLVPPAGPAATVASGTDSQPGATPLRMRDAARAGVALGGSSGGAVGDTAAEDASAAGRAGALAGGSPATPAAGLLLAASGEAHAGDTLAVTLLSRTTQRCSGELHYDPAQLQPASEPRGGAAPGRWPFALEPQGEAVVIFRVLQAAAGQTVLVQASADTTVEGEAQVRVLPAAEEPR